MNSFLLPILLIIYLLQGLAMGGPIPRDFNQGRSVNSCADPSLADIYVVGYDPSHTWHHLSSRANFINDATRNGIDWKLQGPAFIAWKTAQEFTVPLYELVATNPDDLIFLPANSDGTPPSVSGYTTQGIIAYIYSTQVCGSVPLLAAFEPTVADHYYTTSIDEHGDFLNLGWVNEGSAGFVLPIPTDGAWAL